MCAYLLKYIHNYLLRYCNDSFQNIEVYLKKSKLLMSFRFNPFKAEISDCGIIEEGCETLCCENHCNLLNFRYLAKSFDLILFSSAS